MHTLLSTFLLLASAGHAADYLVFTGAYTGGPVKGIYAYHFSTTNGKLSASGVAVETPNPSFLVENPNHQFVYAVNEKEDTVSAFAVDFKHDRLVPLNRVSSRGKGPCHLAFDRTGRWLAVANNGDGALAILPVGADGKPGEAVAVDRHEGSSIHPEQKGPHAHGVVFSPDNRFLLLADLGLDKIFVYHFDAARGAISPNDLPFVATTPGSGPRHLVFHPSGEVLYSLNQLNSTVTSYFYDDKAGTLNPFQTVSTLPAGFMSPNTAAGIAVSSGGTLLYCSNRGNDTIALFSIGTNRRGLTPIDHTPTLGQTPREFAIDETGSFLLAANQDSSSVMVFKMQRITGQLSPAGRPVTAPAPTAVLMIRTK
ncbi:MAG: lactonase family protein [Bryobacteraceae bacterium]